MTNQFTFFHSNANWQLCAASVIVKDLESRELPRFECQMVASIIARNAPDYGMFSFQDDNLNPHDRDEVLNHPLMKPIIDQINETNRKWGQIAAAMSQLV